MAHLQPRRLQSVLGCIYLSVPRMSGRPNQPDLDRREETDEDPRSTAPAPTKTASPSSTTTGTLSSIVSTPSESTLPGHLLGPPSAIPPSPVSPVEPTSTSLIDGDDIPNRSSGVVNLYFLLLGLLIAILIIIYWFFARRRKGRKMASATRRQHALAADLIRNSHIDSSDRQNGAHTAILPGGSRLGRWRMAMAGSRAQTPDREEGLDERGEAPPPYLAKVPAAVVVDRRLEDSEGSMELQNRGHGRQGQPPEYSPLSASAGHNSS